LKKSQDKVVEVTVNNEEETPEDFCLDFVQEFGLCTVMYNYVAQNFVHSRASIEKKLLHLQQDQKEYVLKGLLLLISNRLHMLLILL
jgi:hypothetical protein